MFLAYFHNLTNFHLGLNFKHICIFETATPFGQVPVLEVDGIQLWQSHAIERFLARRFGECLL